MNIQWIIEQMWVKPQVDGEADVVVTAAWRCNGRDGEYSGTVYGTCGFTQPSDSFTPFYQLTQEQVLGWCWNSGVDKEATELNIETQISNQVSPPVVTPPLPWNTAPAVNSL